MPIQAITGGTLITGNAINWYAACVLRMAIKMHLDGFPSRRRPAGALREAVSAYTGINYARSAAGLRKAYADLEALLSKVEHPDHVTRTGRTA